MSSVRSAAGRVAVAPELSQTARPGAEPVEVLHLINGEFYAGAERVQELLANRLPAFGYRARFVCLKRGQFQQALERGPHPCLAVTMGSRLDVVRHARTVARHARETGCRLIHTHTPRSALVGSLAAVLAGLPMVHHVHSPTTRDSARRLINAVNAIAERAALLRAKVLIPVSGSLADYLREQGYRDERVVTIPNGVAVPEHDDARAGLPCHGDGVTASRDGMTLRRDGVIDRRDGVMICTVALFRPRKGIEVLLKALALLAAEGGCARLRAVGPFETAAYEDDVRRLCRELGIEHLVEWRGFREDVLGELAHADLLALPSLFGEGMPMVVLEAMSVGLPVVASRVEGVPEVVRDGQDGVLVEPGDHRALAHAIGRLAAAPDTLAAMGRSGRCRQRDTFSDLAMAERLARVYDRLL